MYIYTYGVIFIFDCPKMSFLNSFLNVLPLGNNYE